MNNSKSPQTLVIVSNMYPSDQYPTYGVFVKRFVEQMASRYRIETLVMCKTSNRVKRAILYMITNLRLCVSLIRNRHAVHYIHFPLYFAPALLVSPLVSTQVILNFHGTDNLIDRPHKRLLASLLEGCISSMQIVAPSATFLSQVAERYDLRPDQLNVSASAGVDSRRYYPAKKPDIEGQVSAQRVGFVGNLLDIKGWDIFIDTAIALDKRGRCGPIQFVLAGSGHDEAALNNRLKNTHLSIQRLGSLAESELAELYNNLDVLIFPSRRESLGLVALECLSCGTPVVAQSISGPMEYIQPGVNGDLCAVGDIASLATAVERILNGDKGNREKMRVACVQTTRSYEAEIVAERMHALVQSIFDRADTVKRAILSKGPTAHHELDG